jgi:hypothetical protein
MSLSSRLRQAVASLHERHERLKNYVHDGFRYPLPPWGRAVMGVVYFSLPLIAGYHIMNWSDRQAAARVGLRGENLAVKDVQGLGDQTVTSVGGLVKVGGGGWGGGVRLAVSNAKVQQDNKEALEKFFRQQQRKKEKMKERDSEKISEAIDKER